jgi:hypothetical protein
MKRMGWRKGREERGREIGRNDTQMSKQARRIIRRFNMVQYGLEEGLNTWMASGDQHPAPYCAKLEKGSSSYGPVYQENRASNYEETRVLIPVLRASCGLAGPIFVCSCPSVLTGFWYTKME